MITCQTKAINRPPLSIIAQNLENVLMKHVPAYHVFVVDDYADNTSNPKTRIANNKWCISFNVQNEPTGLQNFTKFI